MINALTQDAIKSREAEIQRLLSEIEMIRQLETELKTADESNIKSIKQDLRSLQVLFEE